MRSLVKLFRQVVFQCSAQYHVQQSTKELKRDDYLRFCFMRPK